MHYNYIYNKHNPLKTMQLEQLFLKKQELPILNETCFQIPIHPRLLDSNLKIDTSIASRIFSEVAEDWYEELSKYTPEDSQKKEWLYNVFLKEKPVIEKHFGHQMLNFWEDNVNFMDNGLVQCFSISRNAGGSIYFNEDGENCLSFGQIYIKFSDEKLKEFEYEKIGDYSKILTYSQHNIDHYPGALFLRNWAIKYMNEVFKQVFR